MQFYGSPGEKQSRTSKRHSSNELGTLYYPSANSLTVKQHIPELVMFTGILKDEGN